MADFAWAQLDELRSEARLASTSEINKYSEYLCPCGGTKTMGFSDDNLSWTDHTLPTCTSCGRCDDAFISDEPEWRGGMDDDGEVNDPSRCGAPTDDRFSESWSMGTVMSVRSTASYALKKLARIDHHTSMNYKDRSLFHNYQDIERAGKTVMNLPVHVVKEAEHMYRKFGEQKLTRGAVRTGMKANCLLHACKQNNISRSAAEMATAFGIPVKDVSRTSGMFREVILTVTEKSVVSVTQASDLAARMFNDLTMIPDEERRRLRMRTIRICEDIQECVELMGKTPKTIAATVIYVVLEKTGYTTKATISTVCGVSAPTINKIEDIVKLKISGAN
jgi:transcription initiation factor TFIIIB Brf1 subunit/transcription initiation factor TFIIB